MCWCFICLLGVRVQPCVLVFYLFARLGIRVQPCVLVFYLFARCKSTAVRAGVLFVC